MRWSVCSYPYAFTYCDCEGTMAWHLAVVTNMISMEMGLLSWRCNATFPLKRVIRFQADRLPK